MIELHVVYASGRIWLYINYVFFLHQRNQRAIYRFVKL